MNHEILNSYMDDWDRGYNYEGAQRYDAIPSDWEIPADADLIEQELKELNDNA